jgi:multiple sugar transport system ATP-binding protein
VELVEALGSETQLSIALIDSPVLQPLMLQVRVPPDQTVQLGQDLWLAIAPDKIHLFDPETEVAIQPR